MPLIKSAGRSILSEEEVQEIIHKADTEEVKALFVLLFRTGCRITEALNLKIKDFVILENYLKINLAPLKRGKEAVKYEHDLFIKTSDDDLMPLLLDYLTQKQETSTNTDDKLFTISRFLAWHKLKKVSPTAWLHLFRHTRATRLAVAGKTAPQLMAWFGWKDMRPASKYIQRNPELIEGCGDVK